MDNLEGKARGSSNYFPKSEEFIEMLQLIANELRMNLFAFL